MLHVRSGASVFGCGELVCASGPTLACEFGRLMVGL